MDFFYGILLGIGIASIMVVMPLTVFNGEHQRVVHTFTQEGIERNFLEYCSKTGELSWIGECE